MMPPIVLILHFCCTIILRVLLGADSDFLIFALSIAKNSVYSLHKTTTLQVSYAWLISLLAVLLLLQFLVPYVNVVGVSKTFTLL